MSLPACRPVSLSVCQVTFTDADMHTTHHPGHRPTQRCLRVCLFLAKLCERASLRHGLMAGPKGLSLLPLVWSVSVLGWVERDYALHGLYVCIHVMNTQRSSQGESLTSTQLTHPDGAGPSPQRVHKQANSSHTHTRTHGT
mmetsp:Transcript_37046/g.92924  ORF Transcript_37046/g.92924 Transcript_37046/m.92924 type:complete len:141 (+) Transcript_37046:192-614(+)